MQRLMLRLTKRWETVHESYRSTFFHSKSWLHEKGQEVVLPWSILVRDICALYSAQKRLRCFGHSANFITSTPALR